MADWRTYAKAARNTARRQAPGARDAARRATDRAGDYVRRRRGVDEGWREDEREPRDQQRESTSDRRPRAGRRPPGARRERDRETTTVVRTAGTRPRPRPGRGPAASSSGATPPHAAVASRRAERANIVPRMLRALRDALLIGLSLLVLWGVLAAAGIPIPFTTVLIAVGLIVALSFGIGLYGQWRRSRAALDEAEDPRDL